MRHCVECCSALSPAVLQWCDGNGGQLNCRNVYLCLCADTQWRIPKWRALRSKFWLISKLVFIGNGAILKNHSFLTSVVDPDPVGSEPFRSDSVKNDRIRPFVHRLIKLAECLWGSKYFDGSGSQSGSATLVIIKMHNIFDSLSL